jgi:hypothetical protein
MENNETDCNSPAFSKSAFYHPDGGFDSPNTGLTKREYFSSMALQGFITKYGVDCQEEHVKQSIFLAEFFINELNKPKKK